MAFLKGKTAAIGLALASALALGGCYDDGYGYGGVSAGYGYYDDGYYGGYNGGPGGYYGGGFGYPSYGWYDGFYYPGNGYYVYDRGGSRHRWNDNQRRYWDGRRDHAGNWQGRGDGRPGARPNNGRPGDGRPGDGRWNGRRGDGQYGGTPGRPAGVGEGAGWRGRPDRPANAQAGGRPDGSWRGRGDRSNRAGAVRSQGATAAMPRAERPQVSRPQSASPRAQQSFRNAQRGRGNPAQ